MILKIKRIEVCFYHILKIRECLRKINSIYKWFSLLNNIYGTVKYIKDICMSKKK